MTMFIVQKNGSIQLNKATSIGHIGTKHKKIK